jgi:RNA-directed DNA polymerase
MFKKDAEDGAGKRSACGADRGRNSRKGSAGASEGTARRGRDYPEQMQLMEAVVGRENMIKALRRVEANQGAAGVDGMPVTGLRAYLKQHWPSIKEQLLEGRYEPAAVRAVEIPKPGDRGVRVLGIPTVVDRLIQQGLHQVMQPVFEPQFSESSFGFRPGRSAHQAVRQARAYVAEGRRWVVDVDLEKFFDRVNHDILMSRVARKIRDKRVLGLIRRYLSAGVMAEGLVKPRSEGTPQGGPLSPLLSNILLDELDQELERRGHRFCRYADDANIYVCTRRSGERVMFSVTRFLEKRLKLRVNGAKSAVDRPWRRKFLGYSMSWHRKPRLKVAAESVKRLKDKLRGIVRRNRSANMRRLAQDELTPLLRGWINYFQFVEIRGAIEQLDQWLRRQLRCSQWRQWKRAFTRARNLMKLGLAQEQAWRSATNGRGPWWNAVAKHMNLAMPKKHFDALGLVSLLDQLHQLQRTSRTAVYGTVRTVV